VANGYVTVNNLVGTPRIDFAGGKIAIINDATTDTLPENIAFWIIRNEDSPLSAAAQFAYSGQENSFISIFIPVSSDDFGKLPATMTDEMGEGHVMQLAAENRGDIAEFDGNGYTPFAHNIYVTPREMYLIIPQNPDSEPEPGPEISTLGGGGLRYIGIKLALNWH